MDEEDIDEINSGNSLSLTLELQDEFDNIVRDGEKYYSDIGIYTKLLDINKKDTIEDYFIKENGFIFNNGNILLKMITYNYI